MTLANEPANEPRAEVFLTGATGTVGRAILTELLATRRYNVTCMVRSPDGANWVRSLGGAAIVGEMQYAEAFEVFAGHFNFDYVVHAAQADYSRHSAVEVDRIDRVAVENLERLRTAATKLMVYTSGVWVFGPMAPGEAITPRSRLWPFPAAKGRAELLKERIHRPGTPWLELCPPSIVYGAHGAVPQIVAHLRERDLETIDDPRVLWSVIESGDLARAAVAALDHGRPGDRVLAAEERPVAVVEFYEAIAAELGAGKVVRRPRAYLEMLLPVETVARMYASQPVDASEFRAASGWSPRCEFRRTIRELVAR